MKSIEKEIARIISRAAMIPEAEVRPDSKLSELGVNSLDQVECVIAVEEAFQIEVDPQALWRLQTVEDVIQTVRAATAQRR
jgi:acyl carrier protein